MLKFRLAIASAEFSSYICINKNKQIYNIMIFATRHNQTASKVIAYTNHRLEGWYKEVKESYGIDGFGEAKLIGDEIVIAYRENGRTGFYKVGFWQEEEIDFVFNVWSESADIDNDELKKDVK